jgi:hypothetical protein
VTAIRAVVAIALAIAGCHRSQRGPSLGDAREGVIIKVVPQSADLDMLFVIDNSASTSDKQAAFVANFARFMQALDTFAVGRPNLHIGVISTTVDIGVAGFDPACPSPAPNDNGKLQATARVPGCAPPTGSYIIDLANPSGGRTTNYPSSETLADAFACIAQLGTSGCELEAPLEAIKRALDPNGPNAAANAGFVRDGAYLAIVIVTDEDDCSIGDPSIFALPAGQAGPADFRCQPLYAYTCDQPISATAAASYTSCTPRVGSYLADPSSYAQLLTSTIKNAQQTVVAVIGGDAMPTIATGPITSPFAQSLALLPSCSTQVNGQTAIARPGIRLASFASQFGDHGLFETICADDYSQAITNIGNLLFAAISPCLEGPIDPTDVDPTNPGVQLACSVSDVQNAGTSMQVEEIVPPCRMADPTTPAPGQPTCYWISSNPTCTSPTGATELQINFLRTGGIPVGTVTEVACLTRPGS